MTTVDEQIDVDRPFAQGGQPGAQPEEAAGQVGDQVTAIRQEWG